MSVSQLFRGAIYHLPTVITSASCLARGVEYLYPPSSVELHLAPATRQDGNFNLLALRESCLAVRVKLLLMIDDRDSD
jgi:hypothetical protein